MISNDLLAHDIDEGTFDNLLLLVLLAFAVVVVMLSIAFRSLSSVAFLLVGLTSALIWTYGILNVSGARFTALEATVAPLVLGLGIDYAIHLQRAQRSFRDDYPTVAESWLRACGHLSMPLSLAVDHGGRLHGQRHLPLFRRWRCWGTPCRWASFPPSSPRPCSWVPSTWSFPRNHPARLTPPFVSRLFRSRSSVSSKNNRWA